MTRDTASLASGGPLSDVTVIEFAGLGPGPYAAMLLADMGAKVIVIDRPDARAPAPTDISQRGRSQRIAADLKNPLDVQRVRDLLGTADAVIEGFRPGTMERLGLGPEIVLVDNPRLVYGRVTGWGQTGPLARTAGHDINYIAITGALAAIGPKERPVPPLNLLGDFAGGSLFLVSGVLAAILAARRTGYGQVVDAAMCDGAVSLMTAIHEKRAEGVWTDARESNIFDGGLPHYRIYECSDGRHISVGALEPQFYERLCRAIGFPAPPPRSDPESWPELRASFEAIFKARTRDEWTALLELGDHCVAPVLDSSEAQAHKQLVARSSFIKLDGVTQTAPVPRFSRDKGCAHIGIREVTPLSSVTSAQGTAGPHIEFTNDQSFRS